MWRRRHVERAKPGWAKHLLPIAAGGLLVGAATVVLMDVVSDLPLGPGGTPFGNGALVLLYLVPLGLLIGEAFCLWQRAWLAALVLPFSLVIGYLVGVPLAGLV
jgi:hypothetical protein